MATIELDKDALDELGASFRGELVRPPDATYEEHRKVWNGSIDRHPALIARCAGVADVIAAVSFAKEARTVRAQAGALWGELDRETQFGLATTGGIVTHTGVAGPTLGGGIGWLHRKHGPD